MVIYDNDSYIHIFPMGLGALSGILDQEGHDVVVWSQDVHHYPDEALKIYLDEHHFDAVMISVIAGYSQYARLMGLSKAINESKNRPFFMLGGYGPTPEPEFFMTRTGADLICLGEGETTLPEIMKTLEDKGSFMNVLGVAYWNGDTVTVNARRGQIEDLDSLPISNYKLFEMQSYRLFRPPNSTTSDFAMPMMSGRGCTFRCTFCYRMDVGYRARDPEALMDEIEYLNKEFGITYISFQDDLLMTSVEHTEQVCEAFAKRRKKGLEIKWNCNGRLNYVSLELLQLMKKNGCVFINYGIESMDNTVLKFMKKGLRDNQIISGIESTLEAGISPGLNMMFGNIGDTSESLKKSVNFLLKYDDFAQMRTIRPVTPYPGSPLYYRAIELGLLEGPEDFYDNKHLNSDLICVNFTDLSDDEFYDGLYEANLALLENYHLGARTRVEKQLYELYKDRDTTFRGFRHSG